MGIFLLASTILPKSSHIAFNRKHSWSNGGMKRLRNDLVGVDQGDDILFSDFEDGGGMWTGKGPREERKRVAFSEAYRAVPAVHVTLSMWDMHHATNVRADIAAENIDLTGFDVVFRTWGDTKVARARVRWMAIGELDDPEDWQLY